MFEMLQMLKIKRTFAHRRLLRPDRTYFEYAKWILLLSTRLSPFASEKRDRTRKDVECTPPATKYFIKYFWHNARLQISTWIQCMQHAQRTSNWMTNVFLARMYGLRRSHWLKAVRRAHSRVHCSPWLRAEHEFNLKNTCNFSSEVY